VNKYIAGTTANKKPHHPSSSPEGGEAELPLKAKLQNFQIIINN